ncbi:hypothetical protein L7F22_000713 [Adiantum nelumboides]|nr:hypothetical protein [Adiantum nelumboides]
MVEKEDLKVKSIRSDRGGEFLSEDFARWCKSEGIRRQLTTPYTPSQNGVVERKNRTIMEMARAMLAHASLPRSYWAEACNTAVYIQNRSPTHALQDMTPFQAYYGCKPTVSHFRVFGCSAFVHIPKEKRQKLDFKSRKLLFLGYSAESNAYRLYDPDTRTTTVSRDVVFDESFGTSAEGATAQPIPILPPLSLPDPPASPVITPSTSHPIPPIQPPDVSPDHALSDSDSDLDVAHATPEVDSAPPRREKRIPGWLYSTVASSGVTELPVLPPAGLPRLVEDLNKRRQPLPALEAVYFIQPKLESVRKLRIDFSGKTPLYKKAHVFFSSPVTRDLVQAIKSDTPLFSRIATLREMNLEYLTIDSQAFSTDNGRALEQLFGEHSEGSRDYNATLNTIATRLGTVFASLKELPVIRYRAARSAAADSMAATTFRDIVPTKLAAILWDRLQKYKGLSGFPQEETCELLIVDRSIDPIAPVIHEWTYDAMCHDLLNMEGNKYVYEITTSAGRTDRKEVLLEEHDPVWAELRHLHIAAVNKKLDEKMTTLKEKNKAAQIRLGSREGQELTTRDMQKMVQALPQFRDQIEKLSLHIDIATKLNAKIAELCLREVGSLEQELIFGDASSKELINILTTKENLTKENKLRLLMIYAASHPEKLDAAKRLQWMKLARLTEEDMNPVVNMEYMGVSVSKKQSGGFSLKFGTRKKRGLRKEKNQDEEVYDLARFCPMIQEVLEDLAKGELSKEEYPYVKEPSATILHSMAGDGVSVRSTPANSKPVQSMRTSKPSSTWATRSRTSDDGQSSESALKHAYSDPKITGKRIFVFVVGGATRSELRAVHKLTTQFRREVVLGSTSLDEPHEFLTKLKLLSVLEEVSLDELDI